MLTQPQPITGHGGRDDGAAPVKTPGVHAEDFLSKAGGESKPRIDTDEHRWVGIGVPPRRNGRKSDCDGMTLFAPAPGQQPGESERAVPGEGFLSRSKRRLARWWTLRRECCVCHRRLGGNPWAGRVSHGYCRAHFEAAMREVARHEDRNTTRNEHLKPRTDTDVPGHKGSPLKHNTPTGPVAGRSPYCGGKACAGALCKTAQPCASVSIPGSRSAVSTQPKTTAMP